MPSNEDKIRKVLGEITKDCHCKDCFDPYCILIEILISKINDVRFLIQMKCVEKFKYEIGNESGKHINWNEAYMQWIESGLAAKFAEEYKEDISFEEIYKKVRPTK